jgi:hypothetical protein
MRALALALLALGSMALAHAGPDVACPRTYKQATGPCDPRTSSGEVCTYPEGRCSCVRSVPCSGVPQPAGEPAWKCEPKRTDGCPDVAPTQGAACTKPNKKCVYGHCGSIELTCDAKTKKWIVSAVGAPPPSAPGGGLPHPGPAPKPEPAPDKKPDPAAVAKQPPEWKRCPGHEHFGCETRSQGVAPAPGETLPEVCGCIPICPSFRSVLISQEAEGRWPDGTRKGTFTCARDGIP